jgi:hypothetical protein
MVRNSSDKRKPELVLVDLNLCREIGTTVSGGVIMGTEPYESLMAHTRNWENVLDVTDDLESMFFFYYKDILGNQLPWDENPNEQSPKVRDIPEFSELLKHLRGPSTATLEYIPKSKKKKSAQVSRRTILREFSLFEEMRVYRKAMGLVTREEDIDWSIFNPAFLDDYRCVTTHLP